ncbi:S26 family signal peptidase [uncultured Roseobacter sp.]|uniref:S26 family signal peptidase n=1 Tax=uncultured Roseobacter sp. TaxID=114847 RepID=UPI00261A1930|nr:S26 family signal peptidase [uncultured Roseobacter sp.]
MKYIWLVGIAIPVLLLGVASLTALPKKLVYNPSKSAPIGFYWVDQKPVRHGDFAFVRVPAEVRDLVEERGYLPPDVPLLKRVMALSGDEICRLGHAITVNGRVVATALAQDSSGRNMPCWQGCQVLGEGDVFLLQDHPQSFDGRYFGPVDRRLIIGRARLLRFPWRKQ